MVELKEICFAYPGRGMLLDHVSLRFPKGRITAVIGPNGSGKSTLLKVASHLLRPASGRVLMGGHDLKRIRPKERARKLAYLAQKNHPQRILVRDMVAYGRYAHQCCGGRITAEDESIIRRAMEQTQIEREQDQLVAHLSGGQQQRVYLAMALAQDTPIIFLDEPTTCLDVHVSFEIMELVRRLHEEGKTIVMVLHDLLLALTYSDHIILMDGGRIAAQGSPQQIMESGAIDEVFRIHTRVFHEQNKPYYHFERQAAPPDQAMPEGQSGAKETAKERMPC